MKTSIALLTCAVLLGTAAGRAASQQPPPGVSWSRALDQPATWYGSAEAVRVADNVLLYQHRNGGWSKNVDMAAPLDAAARTALLREREEGGTTIDNGATHTQLRFLAHVHAATNLPRFRDSLLRGIDYLLSAQYPGGGWPQYFPLRQGYYEHVTFNDDAMIGVLRLLRDVASGREPFAAVDATRRARAGAAVQRGVEVILRTQVVVDGEPTAWCAQYDRVELRCAKARAYELPSLSGAESVGIARFLMEIPDPSPAVVRAVDAAVRWLDRVKLTGVAVVDRPDPSLPRGRDRVVVADPAAPPLWARFYAIGTDRPIFVGRDGVIRDSLSQIEHERRIGYSYLGGWGRELLEREYPAWKRERGAGGR